MAAPWYEIDPSLAYLIRANCTLLFLLDHRRLRFLNWWAPWLFDYAILHSAIILAPNYRLLPEAKGLDILSDVNDFFDWVHSDLQTSISKSITDVEVDTKRIFIDGDRAGKYLRVLPIQYTCMYPRQSKHEVY